MKITYIGHSGFSVEIGKSVLVFDYFEGKIPEFDVECQIYFFVSHKHADHFNFTIFDYAKKYPNIMFILSNDIKMNERYMDRKGIPCEARDKICRAKKNDTFTIGDLDIRTLTSTDEGVAYIVGIYDSQKGKKVQIYHAGDLNLWTWNGEEESQNEEMTKNFVHELKKIEGETFELAFVVLDPRQEDQFYQGYDYFMKHTNTECVVPMHCWEDYSVINKLIEMEVSKEYRDKMITIRHRDQSFVI